MNITDTILKQQKQKLDHKVNHLPNIIVSVFTIIFCLSIVLELKETVEIYMLIILSAFLTLFLIFNERIKFVELVNFHMKRKFSLITLLITFVLSVGLSVIGIYLWVNKSSHIEKKQLLTTINETNKLTDQLNNSLNAIQAHYKLTSSPEYIQEYENLTSYKRQLKTAYKPLERKELNDKIDIIQNNIRVISNKLESNSHNEMIEARKEYNRKINELKQVNGLDNKSKSVNNLITCLMLILLLVNDFVAIIFAKNVAQKQLRKDEFMESKEVKKYLKQRNILKSYLMTKKVDSIISILELKELTAADWTQTQYMFNIMELLNIIQTPIEKPKYRNELNGVLILDTIQALKKYDEYYNNLFQ